MLTIQIFSVTWPFYEKVSTLREQVNIYEQEIDQIREQHRIKVSSTLQMKGWSGESPI
jgi:hypothetical protein